MHIYDPDSTYLSHRNNNNTKFLLPKLEVSTTTLINRCSYNSVMHIEFNADAQAVCKFVVNPFTHTIMR